MLSYAAYDLLGSVLGLVALPLLPLLLLSRHGHGLAERLGRVPAGVRALRRPLWVHAASVGEVLAAAPLVERLRVSQPDTPIIVSTTSVTGRETARAQLGVDGVMLLPVDLRWIVGRVMRAVRPRCLVIVETEIWPALIRAAARQQVPCVIVSGRISERAATRYAWIGWLTRAVLAQVEACAMQTDADAARLIAMGAPALRVQVLGSLKFAREIAGTHTPERGATALVNDRPLLVAASTHPGEEQVALDACAGLWAAHPRLLLLIAPRRPERFDEVDRLLAQSGLRCERRTRVQKRVADTTQVLLLDTIGELPNVLATATAVFVGGTIAPVGGHNVLEPALCAKPVAFGPHTANVHLAAEALLQSGAAVRVHDANELGAEWRRLLAQPQRAQEMGTRGRDLIAAHAAVAERTCELVRRSMAEA